MNKGIKSQGRVRTEGKLFNLISLGTRRTKCGQLN